jgi:hypothetical protein
MNKEISNKTMKLLNESLAINQDIKSKLESLKDEFEESLIFKRENIRCINCDKLGKIIFSILDLDQCNFCGKYWCFYCMSHKPHLYKSPDYESNNLKENFACYNCISECLK